MQKWLAVLTLLIISFHAKANLTIQIDTSSDDALPIAIIPFSWETTVPNSAQPKTDIASVISADLYRSGKFKALELSELPATPSSAAEVDYPQWRNIDIDNILIGKVTGEGKGLYTVEMRFLDVLRKKQIIGKRWRSVPEALLRQVAHKMSDMMYEELTGIRGAFNTKMAYVTIKRDQGKKVYQLEVADSDGYNSQPILKSKRPIMSPSWSPDGKKLAYVSFENGRSEIFVQSLDGKYREKIASFKGINGAPNWSPDGNRLSMTLSKDGSADIFIMDLNTRKLRRLTKNWAIETEATWSSSGQTLFFNSDRRGKPQIFQVFLDTGEIRRVSFEGRYNANPAVSPDGRYVAMVHSRNGFHIGLLDLYTNEFNIITKTFLDESPTFSPNGEMILYAMNERGTAKLAVVSVDNSVTQVLSVNNGEVRSPSWGPYIE